MKAKDSPLLQSRNILQGGINRDSVKSKSKTIKVSNIFFKQPKIKYYYRDFQNEKFNDYMEDVNYIEEKFNYFDKNYLFCLFDGHGGDETCKYCQKYFAEILKEQLDENDDTEKALENTFKIIEEKLKEENFPDGSTATAVLIRENKFYCGNVGDSRCVIVNNNNMVIRISVDHRVSNESEFSRILKMGGTISEGRINGEIMLSRSLGDFELKGSGLISEPYLESRLITQRDKCCVIASDGVWDVISEKMLKDIVERSKDCEELCNNIIEESIKEGSEDNISCFVIGFWDNF
jgi:serine/threonine protein phosphatase PrpC